MSVIVIDDRRPPTVQIITIGVKEAFEFQGSPYVRISPIGGNPELIYALKINTFHLSSFTPSASVTPLRMELRILP